jgi:uncharacterized protein (DUF2267 family)
MAETGLKAFDTTVHKTMEWLNELMEDLDWEDRHKAYLLLRTTLHALRDSITPEEAVELAAQLPMLIRGVYYEGWRLHQTPPKARSKEDFLAQIERHFSQDVDFDAEEAAGAVFRLLARRISGGEMQDVRHVLPRAIRDLVAASM